MFKLNHNLIENSYKSKLDTFPIVKNITLLFDNSGSWWSGHGSVKEDSRVEIIIESSLSPSTGDNVLYKNNSYSGSVEITSIVGSTPSEDSGYTVWEVEISPVLPNNSIEYTFTKSGSCPYSLYGKIVHFENTIALIKLYGDFNDGITVKYLNGDSLYINNVSDTPTVENGLGHYFSFEGDIEDDIIPAIIYKNPLLLNTQLSGPTGIRYIQQRNLANKSLI